MEEILGIPAVIVLLFCMLFFMILTTVIGNLFVSPYTYSTSSSSYFDPWDVVLYVSNLDYKDPQTMFYIFFYGIVIYFAYSIVYSLLIEPLLIQYYGPAEWERRKRINDLIYKKNTEYERRTFIDEFIRFTKAIQDLDINLFKEYEYYRRKDYDLAYNIHMSHARLGLPIDLTKWYGDLSKFSASSAVYISDQSRGIFDYVNSLRRSLNTNNSYSSN